MTSKNLKNFEFRLGRQGILLFAVGMSLLLFFVFVLGVMVGVHIDAYPEKIAGSIPEIVRKQLYHREAKTDEVVVGREEMKNPPSGGEGNNEGEDIKGSSLMEERTPSPIASSSGAVSSLTDKNGSNAGEEGQGAKPSAPAPMGKGQEDKLHPSDSAETDSRQTQQNEGKYLVQAGSFQNVNKAKQFSKKITPLGYNPRIVMTELPKKGKWYRVVIEGFETREEAKKAAAVLMEKIKGVSCVIRPIKG